VTSCEDSSLEDSSLEDSSLEDRAETLVRIGWLAKGLIFAMIGLLGLDIARRGFSSEDADRTGALTAIAGAPAGRLLVLVVAAGLLLYAVWQVWSAAAAGDEADGGERLLSAVRRIGMVGLSVSYALLGITGLQIAWRGGASSSRGEGGSTSPESVASLLLSAPAGRWALASLGLGTIVVAGYHLWKGLTLEFVDDIDDASYSDGQRRSLLVLGVVGFGARSIMLAIAGGLFVISARDHDPDKSAGLDESLRTIADAPFGRWLLGAASIGLIAAGAYDALTFRRQRLG